MKKILMCGLLFVMLVNSYSQNLDLVVTTNGDSIACKIDSITESAIYLQIKTSGNVNWIQTIYNKKDINLYKYGNIDPSKYAFKDGTSIIAGPVQPVYPKKFPNKVTLKNAPNEDLDLYLVKAKKTKKKGTVMSIAGPLVATAGGLLAAASFTLSGDDGGFVFGSLLFVAGIGTTIVGIPILITGSSRVKTINEIKKSRGMTMEFIPGGYYNQLAQNYQPGATFRIRF
jgi:hypothetical protein